MTAGADAPPGLPRCASRGLLAIQPDDLAPAPPDGKITALVPRPGSMDIDGQTLLRFLEPQIRDYGANVEVDTDLWVLFAIPADDEITNAFASTLLREARFAHNSGVSADDQWMLYYVDSAHRADASHWLDDLRKIATGEIRPTSPAHRALAAELLTSEKPHRVAQQLADLADRGDISIGIVREPAVVRGCLDRLHQREPLFFSAFHTLLTHHLVDMLVLLRQMISEDLELKNEIVKAALSRDPFLQSRQDAAVGIRSVLIQFHVINPLDQLKNNAVTNPYAVYMDVTAGGEQLSLPLDGTNVTVSRQNYLSAIHSIRSQLYRGGSFSSFDTQSPWMSEAIAHPFRFLKQRLDSHRELSPLAALYMLERAVDA